MNTSKDTLIAKSYDLLKDTLPILDGLPRKYKFFLGDKIQNRLAEVLELYIQAYYSQAAEKKILLKRVNIHLEILRHYIRLLFELHCINTQRYHELSEKIDEIGRMTGAWIKSLDK